MADKPRPKSGGHWKRPPTRVYDYNYNVGEHYYKPMMKHLDKKNAGVTAEPPGPKTFAERLIDDPLCCGCKPREHGSCDHSHGHPPSNSGSGIGRDVPSWKKPASSNDGDKPGLGSGLGADDSLGSGRPRPGRLNLPSISDQILDSAGLKTPDGFFDDPLADLKKRRPRTADPDDLLNDPFFSKSGSRNADLDDKLNKAKRNALREFDSELDKLDSKIDKLTAGRKGAIDDLALTSSARLSSEATSSVNIRKRSVKATVTTEKVLY